MGPGHSEPHHERTSKMLTTNTRLTKKERKIRRKKLLRMYREDQLAIIWNKVMDEAGFCDLPPVDAERCSDHFPEPSIDAEFEDFDEDYPNKIETLHNLFPCD